MIVIPKHKVISIGVLKEVIKEVSGSTKATEEELLKMDYHVFVRCFPFNCVKISKEIAKGMFSEHSTGRPKNLSLSFSL